MIWQGSFSFSFGPSDVHETIVLSAVSTLIFILAVTLAFMLFRAVVKLYMDRQQNREGSRIRSRLLIGALALTIAPTLFSAFFNYSVLNRTLEKWFMQPVRGIEMNLKDLDRSYRDEAQGRAQAEANWIGLLPETRRAALGEGVDTEFFRKIAQGAGIQQLVLVPPAPRLPILLYQNFKKSTSPLLAAKADVLDGRTKLGEVNVAAALPLDPGDRENAIQKFMD